MGERFGVRDSQRAVQGQSLFWERRRNARSEVFAKYNTMNVNVFPTKTNKQTVSRVGVNWTRPDGSRTVFHRKRTLKTRIGAGIRVTKGPSWLRHVTYPGGS